MAISSLKDVYIDEMRDLWSANDQMQKFMKNLSAKASDQKLKEMLDVSATGIGKHTETLKSILEAAGGGAGAEHCKGMQGLIAEAKKHAVDEDLQRDHRLPLRPAAGGAYLSLQRGIGIWTLRTAYSGGETRKVSPPLPGSRSASASRWTDAAGAEFAEKLRLARLR